MTIFYNLTRRVRKWFKWKWGYDKPLVFATIIGWFFLIFISLSLVVGFFKLVSDTPMEAIAWAASVFGIFFIICITCLIFKKQDTELEKRKIDAQGNKEQLNLLILQEEKELQVAKKELAEAERNLHSTKSFPRQVN